jgi:hypothetical protein
VCWSACRHHPKNPPTCHSVRRRSLGAACILSGCAVLVSALAYPVSYLFDPSAAESWTAAQYCQSSDIPECRPVEATIDDVSRDQSSGDLTLTLTAAGQDTENVSIVSGQPSFHKGERVDALYWSGSVVRVEHRGEVAVTDRDPMAMVQLDQDMAGGMAVSGGVALLATLGCAVLWRRLRVKPRVDGASRDLSTPMSTA